MGSGNSATRMMKIHCAYCAGEVKIGIFCDKKQCVDFRTLQEKNREVEKKVLEIEQKKVSPVLDATKKIENELKELEGKSLAWILKEKNRIRQGNKKLLRKAEITKFLNKKFDDHYIFVDENSNRISLTPLEAIKFYLTRNGTVNTDMKFMIQFVKPSNKLLNEKIAFQIITTDFDMLNAEDVSEEIVKHFSEDGMNVNVSRGVEYIDYLFDWSGNSPGGSAAERNSVPGGPPVYEEAVK